MPSMEARFISSIIILGTEIPGTLSFIKFAVLAETIGNCPRTSCASFAVSRMLSFFASSKTSKSSLAPSKS